MKEFAEDETRVLKPIKKAKIVNFAINFAFRRKPIENIKN